MTREDDKKPDDESKVIESGETEGAASDDSSIASKSDGGESARSETEDSGGPEAQEGTDDSEHAEAEATKDDRSDEPESDDEEKSVPNASIEVQGEEALRTLVSKFDSSRSSINPISGVTPGSVIYQGYDKSNDSLSDGEGGSESEDASNQTSESNEAETESAKSNSDSQTVASVLFGRAQEDEDDDEPNEIEALRKQLTASLETVYKTKKKFPDIPIILLFGLSQSGKTTLAYRLERNARFLGRPVTPRVWKDDNEGAAGTAEMQSHVFGVTAPQEKADKADDDRFILVDFPGENWVPAIGSRDEQLNKNMLKMMSLSTGYIFALEAQQVFTAFSTNPGLERSDDYEKLYEYIANVTDIDGRISAFVQASPPYKDTDEALKFITNETITDENGTEQRDPFVTHVKEKVEATNRDGTNIRTPKPVFVAFTKADALAKSVIEAYLKYSEERKISPPAQLIPLWKEYLDSSSFEQVDFMVPGPSALLHRFYDDIFSAVGNDDTRAGKALFNIMDSFKYPSHGALKAARELFADLCTNTSQLRVDFVSPFDGMKEQFKTILDEDGNPVLDANGKEKRIQLKPKKELEEFGLSDNMDWLKASSIDISKPQSWRKRFRQWFNHSYSTPLLTLWISNSTLKEARYLAEKGDTRFRNSLSKKFKRALIQEKDCELPSHWAAGKWRYLLLSLLPLFIIGSGLSILNNSSRGLTSEPITAFNITQKDIVTPDLLSGFERDLKADWLSLDGVLKPWQEIPRSGISKITDVYRNERRCDPSDSVCRSGADGAVVYLEKVTDIGKEIGFDANYDYNPDDEQDKALAERSIPTQDNTEIGSDNSKLFIPFHRMIASLWLPDPNSSSVGIKTEFRDQLANVIGVKGYPFGESITNVDVLKELERSREISPGANQTDMARALNLHIAMLHIEGLIASRDGRYDDAEEFYRKAVYLAKYQDITTVARSIDDIEWLDALKTEASRLTTVELRRLENNLIVSGFLKRGGGVEGGQSAFVNATLDTITALEDTARRASSNSATAFGVRIIAPSILPAVNARLLRALLAIEGQEEALMSLGAPLQIAITELSAPGPFGEEIAYRNAVASILLEEEINEFGRRMLQKNAKENADSRKLLAGLGVQSLINSGTPLTSENLWGDAFVAEGDLSIVDEERQVRQKELDDFRERLRNQIGKRLMDQAREANRVNGRDDKNTLFKRLDDADWLTFLQKANVRSFLALGISLPLLIFLGVFVTLTVWFIYTYFDNLRAAFKDAFTSRHATDARSTAPKQSEGSA